MDDKITTVNEVSEKNLLPETEKKEIKLKKHDLEIENSSNCNDKTNENHCTDVKRDDKIAAKRLLSEGEASSCFETVSSVDSNVEPDDIDLSLTADEDDLNMIVEIENELAFESLTEPVRKTCHWREMGNRWKTFGYNNKTRGFLTAYTNRSLNFKMREQKNWQSNVKSKNFRYDDYRDYEDEIDDEFHGRDTFMSTRRHVPHDHNQDRYKHHRNPLRNRSSDLDSGSRLSRSSDRYSRSRRSKSSDHDSRSRRSWSGNRDSRSRRSWSGDRDSRSRRSWGDDRNSSSRRSRSGDRDSRSRRSRSSDRDFRSRRSRSSDRDFRSRRSRSGGYDSRSRWNWSTGYDLRSKLSRSGDHDSRSRWNESSDSYLRFKLGRSGYHDSLPKCYRRSEGISRSRTSRGSERDLRHSIKDSLRSKEREMRARRSRSFSKNSEKSNMERNSPTRKRMRKSLSKSPTSCASKRLDSRTPHKMSRKKERTPFLMELERRLQEADQLKKSKKEMTNESIERTEGSRNIHDRTPLPEIESSTGQNNVPAPNPPAPEAPPRIIQNPIHPNPVMPMGLGTSQIPAPPSQPPMPGINQNPVPSFPTPYKPPPPCIPSVGIHFQYSIPTMSVHNLPLVPGPTGVPVHITMSGEQIPHDMDGRPIPVGPNGYYLPLDPTGRLFPHITSPGNQAVPIHMTEDGVLRLPNSDPVPYGPPHQLPVDIDGRVIPIGPDSKPLYSYPHLPRQPPLNLMNMVGTELVPPQQIGQMIPQTPETGSQQTIPPEVAQQAQNTVKDSAQLPKTDPASVDIQNSSQTINNTILLNNYKRKVRERGEDGLRLVEIEKNLSVNPSKCDIKRSTPVKLCQKKTFKEDSITSGSDRHLDFTPGHKRGLERKEGTVEEVVISDEEPEILKAVCGTKTTETSDTNSDAKPNDIIAKKVQQAIRSLCKRNYKPPVIGRFIISSQADPIVGKLPHESPLLRNRIMLPFITPIVTNSLSKNKPLGEEKAEITFKFLPQKVSKKVEKHFDPVFKMHDKHSNPAKVPVFTFDFAVQCDFTTVIVKSLKSKVAKLEAEVVRLRNKNVTLLNWYKNAQTKNENKSNGLKEAQLEVRETNNEIQTSKHSLEKSGN